MVEGILLKDEAYRIIGAAMEVQSSNLRELSRIINDD